MFRALRKPLSPVVIVALIASMLAGLSFVTASNSSPALASAATGSGGEFVATTGRVLDTRSASSVGGYTTPMSPSVWRSVQVTGPLAGVPTSGAGAVQVTVTVLDFAHGANQSASVSADLSTPKPALAVDYGYVSDTESNTSIVALSDSGKIQVQTTSAADVLIDVQGYFTSGNTAAGGFATVSPQYVLNTTTGVGAPQAPLAGGSTTTVQVGGVAGVPADASSVFVNFAVLNGNAGSGTLTAYPSDQPKPAVGLNFLGSEADAIGATVALSSTGAIKIYTTLGPIDLKILIFGYYDGSTTTGTFTPASAAVTTNLAVAANATTNIQVGGVNGIPVAGSGLGAVAMNLEVAQSGSASGAVRIWSATQPEPPLGSELYLEGTGFKTTNMVTSQLGSDGKISLHNLSSDSLTVSFTLEGWYTNTAAAVPNGQSRTQQSITLQASAIGGGSWVTYQYRAGASGAFSNVPAGNVTDGNGNHPSGWPVTTSSGKFTPYTWNIRDTLTAALGSAPDSLIQVQACYGSTSTDPNLACGTPSNVEFAQSAFGDGFATSNVGPGSLALLTGDYEVSGTDAGAAAFDGLSVGRSLTTLAPADSGVAPASQRADASGVFGPSWTSDLAGPADGDGDLVVNDKTSSGYLTFTDTDGSTSTYQATTPTGTYPIAFTGVGNAAGSGAAVSKIDASTITMTDSDDTVTTWKKNAAAVWQVSTVNEAGSGNTTAYTYNAAGLVTRILAPVPSGVSCTTPDTTPGCRSLVLTYQTLTVSGTSVTRLASTAVSLPQTSGTANIVTVAKYDYTSGGMLADAYDPRISPNLKTAYTYTAAGRLATLTPPGQAAWSLSYDSSGRLSTVSRPDPSGYNAVSTVVYSLPLSGTGLPTVTAGTDTTWDETADLPVTGTAIFSPDHTPAGTTASTVSSSDWPYAEIDYLDVNGQQVNTADYGAGAWQLNTTQYDTNGNDVWDLTPGNRAQALTPTSDTDPYVAAKSNNVDRAALLASSTAFNPLDPSEATDTFGPTHPVTLGSGTVIDAQTHVSTTYDQGAPNSDVNPTTGDSYDLPTTTTTTALNVATGTDTGWPDESINHTGYAAVVSGDTDGWTLGAATSSTVQMAASPSSSDLITYTRYDTTGRTIETRLPGDSGGTTPRATDTAYYTATGTGACVSPTQAGLVCSTGPSGQPGTGKPLPVTTYSYNSYGDPTTKTETYGTGGSQVVRTSTIAYDAAERTTSSSITVTPAAAGGTAVPTVSYGYDSSTGLPTTASTGSGASTVSLTTSYNTVGEATSYTDATSNVSHTGYDLDGRATSLNDGKGTTSYTYDSSSEHRGVATGEDIGVSGSPSTFAGTYDAAGNLSAETYPNGLIATRHYDNIGDLTSLIYAKAGSTWMTFTQNINALGQIANQTSPQSSQTFAYDAADRLTTVADTCSGACTTRIYAFDADSNRWSLKAYPGSGTGGATCSSSTTPTTTSYTYDAADRLSSDTAGTYTYDSLGRATTIPAGDAQGIGAHASIIGTATIGYTANDMVATEQQGSTTDTFTLDPDQNRISTQAESAVTTNHYSDDTDSPTWTTTSSSLWNRDLVGMMNGLAATATQAGAVTLDLVNLHGDIIATCADSVTATAISSYGESTEYGAPRNAANAFSAYGWLGQNQRSTNSLAGLTLMGVRLYSPSIGRFQSVDPVAEGNANSYVYPDDPLNEYDTSGKTIVLPPGGHTASYAYSPGGKLIYISPTIVAKIVDYHNLSLRVLRTALHLTKASHMYEQTKGVWVYEPQIVLQSCGSFGCETKHLVTLYIVVDYNKHAGNFNGFLVTAYCQGYKPRCPDYVNTAY